MAKMFFRFVWVLLLAFYIMSKENGINQGQKRSTYLSWKDYFMSVAFLSSQRSKDPSTQVGACIINDENKIVGIGYNGMPNGCSDDEMPWDKQGNWLETKYPYVCHAEMNAIMNKNSSSVNNCSLYSTLFPCNECAKLIIQSGIKKVFYYSNKNRNKDSCKASIKMLAVAGVECEQYIPKQKQITIDFSNFPI